MFWDCPESEARIAVSTTPDAQAPRPRASRPVASSGIPVRSPVSSDAGSDTVPEEDGDSDEGDVSAPEVRR